MAFRSILRVMPDRARSAIKFAIAEDDSARFGFEQENVGLLLRYALAPRVCAPGGRNGS